MKTGKHAAKFTKGQVIIKEKDTDGSNMFVILEGHVGVYKDYQTPNEKQIATLGAGNFFGEMTLFLHKARSATVVAANDVTVFVIERKDAFDFFSQQPQLTYLIVKTLCKRLEGADMPSDLVSDNPPESLSSALASTPVMISDTPPPGFISDTPPATVKATEPASISAELFPEGHQIYSLETEPAPAELIYKRSFKCPVCEKSFQAYAVRATRLKLDRRDKDFRSHYQQPIDTTYYEIVTCPDCYYSNFDTAYTQPIIARFKENIGQITAYKAQIGLDLVEDRSINAVFAGYYLALKGVPLFYKNPEMFTAKIWLRLMWLYSDVKDFDMEAMAAKKAHASYLAAFEKTDATPDQIQQLCVLMGELSIIVKDIPNAKIFFVKARNHRGGSKAMQTQAEDGIEVIRKIESGVIKL